MKQVFLIATYATLLVASIVGVPRARAQMLGPVIFDNEATQGNASHQVPGNTNGADNGVGATITVSANTPITGFGLETYQQSGGNLKFIIYDETTQTYPVITAPKSFGTAYFDFAQSPSFVFTLLSGHTYDLGAISDSDTYYAYGYAGDGNGTTTYSQDGITAPVENILFKNYASPTVNPVTAGSYNGDNFHGTAQFALEIYGVVPEPATWALTLGGIGLLLALDVRHRNRMLGSRTELYTNRFLDDANAFGTLSNIPLGEAVAEARTSGCRTGNILLDKRADRRRYTKMRFSSFRECASLLTVIVVCAMNTLVAQEGAPGGGKPGGQSATPSPGTGNAPSQRNGGPGPGGPPEPFPEAKSISQPKNDTELAAAIKRLTGEVASNGRFSGSILVAADGNILLDDAWGEAEQEHHVANTAETSYDVGSIGKLFTQIAILQLVEARKLTLDDTFGKFLPNYPDHDIAEKVTIRQLLLHTSGMGDIFDQVTPGTNLGSVRDLKGFLPLFVGKPLEFEPGSATRYSNTGYIVLGMVIEAVSGENYYNYIERNILHPAEMTHSGFFDRSHLPAAVAHSYDDRRDVTNTYAAKGSPAGGLQATASDLLKLVQSINAGRLVSPESVKVLRGLIPHPPNVPPPTDETKLTGYGIGGGAPGVSAQLVVDPTGRYTWVVLCNGSPPMAMSLGAAVRQWIKGMPR